jgi:hypothetical protein
MTAYTKNSAGAPVGNYIKDDTVTDSNGTEWVCIVTGNPATFDVVAEAAGGGYDPVNQYQFIEDFDRYGAADGITFADVTGDIGPWGMVVTGVDAGQVSFAAGYAQLTADSGGDTEMYIAGFCPLNTYDFLLHFRLFKPAAADAAATETQMGVYGNNGSRNAYVTRAGDTGVWSLVINGTPEVTTYTEPDWDDELTAVNRWYRLVTTAAGDVSFQTTADGAVWTERIAKTGASFHNSVSDLKLRVLGAGAVDPTALWDAVYITSDLDR